MGKQSLFFISPLIIIMTLAGCRLKPIEQISESTPYNEPPPFIIITEEADLPVVDSPNNDEPIANNNLGSSGDNNNDSFSNISNSDSSIYQQPAISPVCIGRTDWPYIYTVAADDTLSQIARRTQTTVDILESGNCLSNANVISVGQELYVPNAPNLSPQIRLSAISPTISRSYLQSGDALFNITWSVIDRPANSNLRFEQILPNSSRINVELPRNNAYVISEGSGYVRFVYSDDNGEVLLRVTLFDITTGATYTMSDLVVMVLYPPTPAAPVNHPFNCYALETTPTQLYAGFQGSSLPLVGTIPSNTIMEIVTLEFNGIYGIRYHWGELDIAWANVNVQGDCSKLPDYWRYTGHGSGRDTDNGQTCVFVGDTTVPIYANPEIAGDVLHTLQAEEIYLFNAYGDVWQSGDVSGYWIEVYYDINSNIRGYVQNTGGHLEGENCPIRRKLSNTMRP